MLKSELTRQRLRGSIATVRNSENYANRCSEVFAKVGGAKLPNRSGYDSNLCGNVEILHIFNNELPDLLNDFLGFSPAAAGWLAGWLAHWLAGWLMAGWLLAGVGWLLAGQ